MKRFGFFLLASGLFWTGCIENDSLSTASIAQRNVENLARISVGMSSKQVFDIMRKPYRNEAFDLDGDRYEIWFYVTNLTLMDQKTLTHKNLTPLTFKNGLLLGKGYHDYYKVLNQETADTQAEEENLLEKTLNTPPKNPPKKQTSPQNQPPSQQPQPQPQKQSTPSQKPKSSPSSSPKPSAPSNVEQKPSNNPTNKAPSNTKPSSPSQGTISMSKSPSANAETPPPEPAPKRAKKADSSEKNKNNNDNKIPLTEEDQKMIDREQEENFDFW